MPSETRSAARSPLASSSAPTATPATRAVTQPPSPSLGAGALRSDPYAFFATQYAQQSACSAPAASVLSRRDWLRLATTRLLSFGTRVAGSGSSGFSNAHHFVTNLATCDRRVFGAAAEATAHPASARWRVWHDNFTQSTVVGDRSFSNIIAELNHPPAGEPFGPKGHIVISAHYDSKLYADVEFLGACDSAVPVVMMLQLQRDIAAVAAEQADGNASLAVFNANLPSYTFMYFDGEEAFVEWRGDDNTYGSRHLAAQYESRSRIASISLFVLLDLLGPSRPTFHNYFGATTGTSYHAMRSIENALLATRRSSAQHHFFPNEASYSGRVEDDHIPWLNRGVPVLHLIPVPFPPQWHQPSDDGSNIDYDTTVDLYEIVANFTRGFDARTTQRRRRRKSQQR